MVSLLTYSIGRNNQEEGTQIPLFNRKNLKEFKAIKNTKIIILINNICLPFVVVVVVVVVFRLITLALSFCQSLLCLRSSFLPESSP